MAQFQVLGDGLAQLEDAVGGGVAMVAVAQRLDRRLDHVVGRLEIRLADAQVDDVAALGLELLGAGQHLEGALGAEPRDRSRGLQHIRSSRVPACDWKTGANLGQRAHRLQVGR